MKHSRQLRAVGNALFDAASNQCKAIAYGWQAEPQYDADGRVINEEALQASAEAIANARLWAMAPDLLDKAVSLAARLPQDPDWFAASEAMALRQIIEKVSNTCHP